MTDAAPGPEPAGEDARPQCVIEVGHRTLSGDASWLMDGDPERPICDRHKYHYETAYGDYSHIVWVPIEDAYDNYTSERYESADSGGPDV